jgi:hypothetical protein
MYIVMEHADGGSLSEQIANRALKGDAYTDEQIFNYLA